MCKEKQSKNPSKKKLFTEKTLLSDTLWEENKNIIEEKEQRYQESMSAADELEPISPKKPTSTS